MPRMKTFSPRHFAIWKCVCERHCARGRMRGCNHGVQMLVTTAGAFAAFSLMTIAVGTDYWLYSRGVCRTKSASDNDTSRKNEEVLTHSGLWRMCCMEGMFEGMCKTIDHFPEDAHYEQDASEYLLRAVRASSLFPIMSVGLLFIGGLCVAASEFYKSRHNVILSAGIFFVSAGLSNIIGIIVYISANSGDPNQSESKRSHWYGWSFYCGALSFVIAETVGVLTVHLFIDRHRALRARSHYALRPRSHTSLNRRSSSQRSRYRRRPSRSSEPRSRDHSPARQSSDLTLYALSRGFVTTPHTLAHNSINAGRGFSPVPNSFCAGHGYGKDRVHATNSVPTEKVFCHTRNSVSSENGPLRAPAHLQNSENSQKAVMQTQLYKNSVPHPSAPHPNSNNIQNPHNLINEHIHLKNSVKESVHALKTGTVTRRTTPV